MQDLQSNVGDVVAAILSTCYSREHQATLEVAAAQRNISLEQLVAAVIAQKLSEDFTILPKNAATSKRIKRPSRRAFDNATRSEIPDE